ncbi:MAG: glycosyltransferase [Nanoarchaeota archaeon]
MLSIIIPTLNEEKYLPKLLESIKKQKFEDCEIIVADNNSRDGTRKIAKKYGCRITKGGVPPVARNNGAMIANGDLLLFLDADVILPTNFLIPCINEFKKRRLDVATCMFKLKYEKITDNVLLFFGNVILYSAQYFNPLAIGAFLLCKKTFFNRVKGFNKRLKQAEDHDFVKRCKKIGKFRVLKKSILVSMRRFKKEGRFKVLKKYAKTALYMKINGNIDKDIFEYEYGKF